MVYLLILINIITYVFIGIKITNPGGNRLKEIELSFKIYRSISFNP